jgi:hypothetical protein
MSFDNTTGSFRDGLLASCDEVLVPARSGNRSDLVAIIGIRFT